MEAAQAQWVKVHPLIVRVTHWISAFARSEEHTSELQSR